MPKYEYKIIPKLVEDIYKENTKQDVYDALGKVDFTKAKLIVDAQSEQESDAIRRAITDIRMWVAESVKD